MSLDFGGVQIAVLVVFLAIACFFALVFAVVASRSRRGVPFDEVREAGYRLRKRWLVLLTVLLAGTLAGLSFFIPYASGGDAKDVRVVGGQFYWSLSPERFTRGEKVRFDVTSVDVNHGFGLYDPDGHLVGSVQAMPGYHNKLLVTLEKAGTYTIACFEFCGLDHHHMIREFSVMP